MSKKVSKKAGVKQNSSKEQCKCFGGVSKIFITNTPLEFVDFAKLDLDWGNPTIHNYPEYPVTVSFTINAPNNHSLKKDS